MYGRMFIAQWNAPRSNAASKDHRTHECIERQDMHRRSTDVLARLTVPSEAFAYWRIVGTCVPMTELEFRNSVTLMYATANTALEVQDLDVHCGTSLQPR